MSAQVDWIMHMNDCRAYAAIGRSRAKIGSNSTTTNHCSSSSSAIWLFVCIFTHTRTITGLPAVHNHERWISNTNELRCVRFDHFMLSITIANSQSTFPSRQTVGIKTIYPTQIRTEGKEKNLAESGVFKAEILALKELEINKPNQWVDSIVNIQHLLLIVLISESYNIRSGLSISLMLIFNIIHYKTSPSSMKAPISKLGTFLLTWEDNRWAHHIGKCLEKHSQNENQLTLFDLHISLSVGKHHIN